MSARTPSLRPRVAAAAVALGLVLLLAGCFPAPPPPDGSEKALAALLTRLNGISGVKTATGSVRQLDEKDHPDVWLADIRVTADSPDAAVAQAVRLAAQPGVPGTRLAMSFDWPAAPGFAPTTVDPLQSTLVTLADQVRREPLVETVSVTSYSTLIGLTKQATFGAAIDRIRPLLGGGSATLSRADSTVGTTATQPGASLLGVIDALETGGDVTDLSFSVGTPYAALGQGYPDRPRLSVASRSPSAVVAALTTAKDEAADAHLAPRTAFSIRTPGSDTDTDAISGWIGLPLQSPEPDDETLPVKTPDPRVPHGSPPVDPAWDTWVPADVSVERAAVTAFLDRSIEATGVHSVATTTVEQCSVAGTGDQSGSRVRGWTLVPIFTVYDDGQKPFDAVTALWTRDGMSMTDRALGLDLWSASDPTAVVPSATIRGTADGLSFGATSRCVR